MQQNPISCNYDIIYTYIHIIIYIYSLILDQLGEDIQGAFSIIDTNMDKKLTLDELKEIQMLSMTDNEANDLIQEEDVNRSGGLEWPEFLKMVQDRIRYKTQGHDGENDIKKAFARLDANSDGVITKEDLKDIVQDSEESEDMITYYDINNDNRIDFDEFAIAMNSR